jgi:2'-5' RNA ligase
VFCAVELPAEVRGRIADHILRLRTAAPEARAAWGRDEKLHITLKFLGGIEHIRAGALTRAAAGAAGVTPAFRSAIAGAGSFPSKNRPRVLWLGVEDRCGGLPRMQSRLEDACEAEGFAREERPFHPHITIARPHDPGDAYTLASLNSGLGFERIEFPVCEIVVMRSELAAGGSVYTEMSRHKLRGA